MAYSELIKRFEPIRDYMRQFYIYGFKSRTEYDQKSARSYDNERRRLESWLGDFMRFRQNSEGKNVFLSVDSRSIRSNPIYKAFKAKSFTDGDVTFHFYILDLLADGSAHTAQEITDLLGSRYLCHFADPRLPDLSTVRKKLKEYVSLGLLESEKRGRELYFRRSPDTVALGGWEDALSFFSEADPLGVIGSTVLDKLAERPDSFRFKHHYMLHALDSEVMLRLLTAIGENRHVHLENLSRNAAKLSHHFVFPLQLYISTQGGRQYLLCYHTRLHRITFFRLDYIQKVELLEQEPDPHIYRGYRDAFKTQLWGASVGGEPDTYHLELTVRFEDHEQFIPQRLEREKRNGRVERLDGNTCRYVTDVYDPTELIPWLRTFIGRIEKLECSDPGVTRRFWADLEAMLALYGGEEG